MSSLLCVVVTPESTALEAKADFIALPLFDGELGVAPGHAPLIGRLGYGELRLTVGDKKDRYYVDGGFVQVVDNVVTLLTDRAVPANELDREVAHEQLVAAQRRPGATDAEQEIRARLIRQARAQIQVAKRAQGGGPAAH